MLTCDGEQPPGENIDEEVHDQLRLRAADAGTTISDYVLDLIRRDLRRPSRQAWLDTVAHLPRREFGRDQITGAVAANRKHG